MGWMFFFSANQQHQSTEGLMDTSFLSGDRMPSLLSNQRSQHSEGKKQIQYLLGTNTFYRTIIKTFVHASHIHG